MKIGSYEYLKISYTKTFKRFVCYLNMPSKPIKRKAPIPSIKYVKRRKNAPVLYAGRKTPFKVIFERFKALQRKYGSEVADSYLKDYMYSKPPVVFGSHGQLIFKEYLEGNKRIASCQSVFVKDFYRNRGLATRLYKRLEDLARKKGFDELRVYLVNNIEQQEHILQKLGWKFRRADENGKSYYKTLTT